MGKFDGSFFAFGESFYLEPAERYFLIKTPFHSIIFPASSVQFDSSGIQRKMARFKDLQPVVAQVLTFLHKSSDIDVVVLFFKVYKGWSGLVFYDNCGNSRALIG